MVIHFRKIVALFVVLIGSISFNIEAQSCFENCELSVSFEKQIVEFNKRFSAKKNINHNFCTEVASTYQNCIEDLNAGNCSIKDSLLVYLHKQLGNVFRNCNKNQKALAQYEIGLEISNQCKHCNLAQEAHTMFNTAMLKRLQKNFVATEQYFLSANLIYKKLVDETSVCDVWLELLTTYQGWGYSINYQKLDSIYNLIQNGCDIGVKKHAQVNYLAEKYIYNNKYEEAHQVYDNASAYYLSDSSYSYWLDVNINKANLLIKQDKINDVEPIFNKIENIKQKHQLNTKLYNKESDLLQTKAAYHTAQQQYHQAQNYHQQILQFINPLFTYQTIHQNPSPNQIFGNPYLLTTLADKAEVFEKMYRQDKDKTNLTYALECYELSYESADQMRKAYSFEDANNYLSEYTYSYYEKAIELCQTLATVFPEHQNLFQQKAFEIAQRSSMKTLFWEINSRAADYHHLDESTKAKKKQLQTQLVELEHEIKDQPKDPKLKTSRFETLRELEQIDQQLQNKMEGYSDTQFCHFSDFSVNPKTLQNILQPNEALLDYFVGDSLIYCFLVTKNNFQIVEIENPGTITDHIFTFRKAINDEAGLSNIKNVGYQLYQQLLEKTLSLIPKPINNLIVIPDAALSALPFEALQSSTKNHDFLVKEYIISYDLHSYLLTNRTNYNLPEEISVSGFSVEDFSNWAHLGFSPLPNAKREIDTILKLTGGQKFHSAPKQMFIQQLSKAQIIHMATHAIADSLFSANSAIYFSSVNDHPSKNMLTRDEILNYQCNAEMIVLSACETGIGKLNRGEGVASLARAFRTIGSKSEVMSLWKIYDETTAIIISNFYKFLKEGDSKNVALQKAKIHYINSQSKDHKKNPKNWAGLVLQGNVSPLY